MDVCRGSGVTLTIQEAIRGPFSDQISTLWRWCSSKHSDRKSFSGLNEACLSLLALFSAFFWLSNAVPLYLSFLSPPHLCCRARWRWRKSF